MTTSGGVPEITTATEVGIIVRKGVVEPTWVLKKAMDIATVCAAPPAVSDSARVSVLRRYVPGPHKRSSSGNVKPTAPQLLASRARDGETRMGLKLVLLNTG